MSKSIVFWKKSGQAGYEQEQSILASSLSHEEVATKLNRSINAVALRRSRTDWETGSVNHYTKKGKKGKEATIHVKEPKTSTKNLKFIVNGTFVEIGKGVKNVMVGVGVIKVDF
jgi:hypothetical protein